MSSEQKCRTCQDTKPLKAFWKLAPPIALKTGHSHSLDCRECKTAAKDAKAQRRHARQVREPEEVATSEPENTGPKLSLPQCIGVDFEFDGTDFVFTQENEGATHTVFVAPHMLRRIWEFAEGLALKQQDAAEPAS